MPATVTAVLDKNTYAPGETMTLTVAYTVPPESKVSVHAVLGYVGGSLSSPVAEALVKQLSVADDDRTWLLVSDDGATAVYRVTA